MNATGKRIAVERPCRFLSVNSGRVVDVLGGSNEENAKVVQYPWHAGSNQLWNLVPERDNEGDYLRIVSVKSSKCLTVLGVENGKGGLVVQSAWRNSASQKWTLNQIESGIYQIVCKAGQKEGYVLAVESSSLNDGAPLVLAKEDPPSLEQQWMPTSF